MSGFIESNIFLVPSTRLEIARIPKRDWNAFSILIRTVNQKRDCFGEGCFLSSQNKISVRIKVAITIGIRNVRNSSVKIIINNINAPRQLVKDSV